MESPTDSSILRVRRRAIELRPPLSVHPFEYGRRDDEHGDAAHPLLDLQGGESRGLNRAMQDDDKVKRHKANGSAGGESPSSSLDRGFDRWLNRQLHVFFDPVLDQKLPDEIAGLLEQFESRDKQSGNEDEGRF
jgi:hypothetical protein